MNTAHKIAWRYVTGKKSAQAINVISWISMIAILFSTAAMVVLFSVYNGIEGITKDLYTAFFPDLKITPKQGKYFEGTRQQVAHLNKEDGIDKWSYTLEDMALISSQEHNVIAQIVGVNNDWFEINNLHKHMVEGEASLNPQSPIPQAIIGLKLAASLGVEANNIFSNFAVFHPKKNQRLVGQDMHNAYNQVNIQPTGIFRVAAAMDEKYIIVPIQVAAQLLERPTQFSAIAIKVNNEKDIPNIKKSLSTIFPETAFEMADKYEQNKTLYMILNSEKWAVYAILLMVMLVASFNMIGSLSMLALEKKKDIVILKSMGASNIFIRSLFLRSGLLLTGIGALGGLVLGYLICFCQQQFGLVSMGSGFIVDAYPVAFQWSDFLLVLVSVILVGFIASIFPASKAARSPMILNEE